MCVILYISVQRLKCFFTIANKEQLIHLYDIRYLIPSHTNRQETLTSDQLPFGRVTPHSCELPHTPASYPILLRVTPHSSELPRTAASYFTLLRVTPHSCELPHTPASYPTLLRVTRH